LLSVSGNPLRRNAVIHVQGIEHHPFEIASGHTLCVANANPHAFTPHDDMKSQSSHLNVRNVLGGVGIELGCGHPFALDRGLGFRQKLENNVLPVEIEFSRMGWTFWEHDLAGGIASESVRTRFEPEQASEGQPIFLQSGSLLGLPFLERLYISGIGGL